MFEEYHTLTVYFPNKTKPIYIMNVPYDATCATIISKPYSLPIAKEYKGEIVIKCNNEIIHGNSLIDDDVIYVDLCVKQKEKKITKAFFFIFFIVAHISPFVSYLVFGMKLMIILCVYLGLLFMLGLLIIVFKPDPYIFDFCCKKKNDENKKSKFKELLGLFIRSFLPTFRVEQIVGNE